MEKRVAWYCGEMRAEAKLIGNRVVDYRYVPVNGCGELNRPGTTECWNCGKRKPERLGGKAA